MQNPTISELNELIQVCEDIVVRYVNHSERKALLLSMAQFVKYRVTWRNVLYSDVAAGGLWDTIRTETNADVSELIMSMAGEMYFRLSPTRVGASSLDQLYPRLADSLGWPKMAGGLNKEVTEFVASAATYDQVLRDNPWAMFLYLLSMSNIVNRLIAMQVEEV